MHASPIRGPFSLGISELANNTMDDVLSSWVHGGDAVVESAEPRTMTPQSVLGAQQCKTPDLPTAAARAD